MKKLMLATIATLSFTTGMSQFAVAQDMPAPTAQPPGTEGLPTPGNVPPAPGSAHPPGHHGAPPPPPPPPGPPPPPPLGADPNAAQPTGAVPADPGMAPAPAGAPNDPAAPVGSPGNPVTVGGNVTPPPTEAKDYPVCSKTVQDSCVNPGEAKRAKKRR